MSSQTRGTSREEMAQVRDGAGPVGDERLVNYNIFLTDAFSGGAGLKDSFLEAPGQVHFADNDESYRKSRHLLRDRSFLQALTTGEGNLREHSLARQLESQNDESPATIRLIRRRRPEELAQDKSTEKSLPWVNLIPPNTKFFLEHVQENREEKVQVIDTFGEWIAFFFGRKPEVYSYSGTLLNAKNHDWKNDFQTNYDLFLRGSQAVRHKATVFLQYDNVIVEGFILNTAIQMNSVTDKAVPFSFNMLVINRSPVNFRSILGMRIDRSGGTALERVLFKRLNEGLDISNPERVGELETFLLMREYFSGHYLPGAGTGAHRPNTGRIDSQTSKQPGQAGGISNNKPTSCKFDSKNKDSLSATDVTSDALKEFGVNLPTFGTSI